MKLIKTDYMIIIAIFMFLGAHLCTNFLISHYRTAAENIGIAQEIAYEFEGNPVAKWIFQLQGISMIYTYVLMPGLIVGLYCMVRRIYITSPDMVVAFAMAVLVMGLSNFLNDFSILLGVVSK